VKPTKSARKIQAAFHEVYQNEPAIVAKTRQAEGPAAAQRQKVAISLSKARAAGASMPKLVRRSARGSAAPAGQNLTRGYGKPDHAGRPDPVVAKGYRTLGG
jgi:hypothetical protein